MMRLLVIARDSGTKEELRQTLYGPELSCTFTSFNNGVRETVASARPDVLLFEADGQQPEAPEIIRKLKNGGNMPVMALVPQAFLERPGFSTDADDFLVSPYDAKELALRINRVLRRAGKRESTEQIKCDGLTIDLSTCEVTIDGRLVELTFKEYELLKLLAASKGRVYTRAALLDRIWGYDYYGGDRTVDVHVRRLRSKIEDASHTYIETVRNIGYKFIKTG
jgi:two-component system alkaline phosphatase synthesis response regulator PhoP